MSILPPLFESKIGQNNPANQRTLNIERGLVFNRSRYTLLLLLLSMSSLFGAELATQEEIFTPHQTPWFTGPLLSPSGYTVPPGHLNVQLYINAFTKVGRYNSHWHTHRTENFYTLDTRLNIKVGLYKALDFFFAPQLFYKQTKGEHSVHFADLPISFSVQLWKPEHPGLEPAIRMSFRSNIPCGRYQRLNASKQGTDATGTGCWFPGPFLIFSHLIHVVDFHYVDIRWDVGYQFGVPVRVRGLNAYGGDASTRGTEYPGNRIYAGGAIQYNFTQRWAFACDLRYFHMNVDRFSGKTIASMRNPSSESYSLAPAIEYNWSKSIGMIGGIWFSFAGRNTQKFINGMWSLNAYF